MSSKTFRVILILACLVVLPICKNKCYAQDANSLKVITYNIWNGFDWGKDIDRKAKFVNWINTKKPDVLALQELCGYTQEQLQKDAKKWGHDYAEILKTSGYSVGITSNKPIGVKEKILKAMHHGALHCKIGEIDFFVIHFSPFSHQKRREEAKIILNKLLNLSKNQDKYMVLGDFNALSPFDAHLYKNRKELIESKKAAEEQHGHVKNLLLGELEYGVIGMFLGHPLIDVTQKFASSWGDKVSCPTQIFEEKKGEGRPKKSTRIDYILVSPFLAEKCITSEVLNKEETYYLSDHYPVFAEFKL
ncbi:endonuclease/exonuclease/phosphatase family protein [Jejuia spongiicola]|uniref:Endonuclease/exonuclease/phosphatase family protein n=1 Tax=Jejuia spongiicola TaxID=2942207 RepID=A0ABT0QGT9_9FLAO|nr:endonuclease/exonuclease/phosphatase family protein [Jejuia spongiicola]MCL6296182.1 endonuclease/exonuclease/phosphatase family protein [Jejuia spongiicola]